MLPSPPFISLLADPSLPEGHPPVPEGLAAPGSTAASAAQGRYEFLDAVRGLAALFVAIQHGSEMLGLPLGRASALVNLGETGVVAFFLVSGFIIPRSLERHGSLGVFWLGRAFRLYPAYWLSLAGAALLIATHHLASPFFALPHPAAGMLANLAMLQGAFHLPSALGVYWTLSLELIFYLLCSLLFLAGLTRHSVRVLWGAVAAYLVSLLLAAAAHRSIPAGIFGLLVSACFGTVALRALTQPGAMRSLRQASAPLAVALALGLYLRFGRFPVPHAIAAPPWTVVVLSWILGYTLFFVCFAMRHRHFPPVLLWLGRISYSFYLMHVLVFVAMPRHGSAVATLLLNLLLTALLAEISYRAVERPALLLQRRLMPLART